MNKVQFRAAYREFRSLRNTSAWYGFWAQAHEAARAICGADYGVLSDAAIVCVNARAEDPVTLAERLSGFRMGKVYDLFASPENERA